MTKLITKTIFIAFLTILCAGNLTAQETYTVNASANPPTLEECGGGVMPKGPLVLEAGISMSFVACPSSQCEFINWTENGEVISENMVYSFIVSRDLNIVANFAPIIYEVTVSANPPEGGTVIGGGSYTYGEMITITAEANPGFLFLNWTEDGHITSTQSNYSFQTDEPRNLVANFVPAAIEITLSQNMEEGGTVSGAGTYSYGQTVIVHATQNLPEYMFNNWTEDGNVVSTKFLYSFTATKSRHLVANFMPAIYEIPVYANPYDAGTVTGGGIYTYGSNVTLSAVANEGYRFLNWTKYIYGTVVEVFPEPNYTFTVIGEPCAFVAYFEKEAKVTLLTNLQGGEVLGGGTYQYGDEVTVEAIPNAGYKFVNWTEGRGIVSIENPYHFTVTESILLIANFEEDGMVNVELVDPESILIYPNPTTGELTITNYALNQVQGRITNMEIFDVYGKKLSPHHHIISSSHQKIDISDFPTGIYFIQFQTEQGTVTKRFVKN
jgi:hypothetical protein